MWEIQRYRWRDALKDIHREKNTSNIKIKIQYLLTKLFSYFPFVYLYFLAPFTIFISLFYLIFYNYVIKADQNKKIKML